MKNNNTSGSFTDSEDDIDLRVYIDMLLCRKWIILGITLIAGAGAAIITFLQPPVYNATSLVAITRPLYQFQFSPNIQNTGEKDSPQQLSGKAGIELASSDSILEEVLKTVKNDLKPEERHLLRFKRKIKVTPGSDPTILKITATDSHPRVSAEIANNAADLYVRYVNNLYGQTSHQETFFETQLTKADGALKEAEQMLIDFQKRNNAAILNAQLNTAQATLNTYLNMNDYLNHLLQNIRGLQSQLSRQPAENPSTLVDDLTALIMQINAFNTQVNTQVDVSGLKSSANSSQQTSPQPVIPIQLQISGTGSLSKKTAGQQAAYMAELIRTVENKRAEIRKYADAIPAAILDLQGQLQRINMENDQLTRQHKLAESVVISLSQKLGETRISSQETSGRVRVASYASLPDAPSRGRLKNTAIAMIIALFLTIFGVFVFEYFHKPRVQISARV